MLGRRWDLRASAVTGLGWGLASLALVVAGCGDDGGGGEDAATVTIMGAHQVGIGETLELSATTANGTDTAYTWSSDNAAVATVSADGTVTGVAAGETDIRATGDDSGAEGSHVVVVVAASAPLVTVTSPQASLRIGETIALTVATTDDADSGYVWTVDGDADDPVARVDETGMVSGVRAGEATVTATGDDTGVSGSVTLVVSPEVPFGELWRGSGHADATAAAFRRWDDDGAIPTRCARCHSTAGVQDYLGLPEGDASGFPSSCEEISTADDAGNLPEVDEDAPVGGLVECGACHNDATLGLELAIFPSRVAALDALDGDDETIGGCVDNAGPATICMTCHQGRSSTDDVDADIAEAGVGDDEPSEDLGFINQHYYAAGATVNAGRVRGGYQYAGKVYDWRFRHVPAADGCVGCHDPHSLEVKEDLCASCHIRDGLGGWDPADGLRAIRAPTSRSDYDGDGLCPDCGEGMNEGIEGEIATLREMLYEAIQAYAIEEGTPVCRGAGYPYFFVDADPASDGGPCGDEDTERYEAWTPRMVRAAYNLQSASVDPGNFAHNAKYTIQLLYDSIENLNEALDTPVDLSNAHRVEPGHFNGAGEAARHWDEDAEVQASCSKCHSGSEGYKFFLEFGVGTTVEENANGLDCAVCHANQGNPAVGERPDASNFALRVADSVLYPSGEDLDIQVDETDVSSNLCGQCHSGRASGVDIESAIAAQAPATDDTVMPRQGFINIHYRPAAASKVGAAAMGGLQYAGNDYSNLFDHPPGNACVYCHNPLGNNHSFQPSDVATGAPVGQPCNGCHTNVESGEDVVLIRGAFDNSINSHADDYDGDGFDNDGGPFESLADEIGYLELGENINDCAESPLPQACGLSDLVLLAMQEVARATSEPICYGPDSYPYFFNDTNDDGVCQPGEAIFPNQYRGNWTPRLLRAAHNYQLSHVDPGAWAHNFEYISQVLYDTLVDLGADVGDLVPPVRPIED